MDLLKVNYTAEEVVVRLKEKYEITTYSKTATTTKGDQKTGNLIGIVSNVTGDTKLVTRVAITKDNYLLTCLLVEDTYGTVVSDNYFGYNTGAYRTLGSLFKKLPDKCKDELVALDYLAHSPDSLGDMITKTLSASANALESKDKDIEDCEQMLVNAHHGMKKQYKEIYSKSWLKSFKVLDRMSWFKGILEKGE